VNIFFAGAGHDERVRDEFKSVVERRYGAAVEVLGQDRLWAGVAGDPDGVVLGTANDPDGTCLVLLGCLNGPAPGFDQGSPMDSPHRAARYLLERYRRDGERFLVGIFGQYAVVVLDQPRGRLVLGSDPTGLRTAFYCANGEGLLVSSNLSALGAVLPGLAFETELLDFFLCYGFFPRERTAYRGVTYLKPGTTATFEQGELRLEATAPVDPWSDRFGSLSLENASEEQAIDALHDALLLATEQQLASAPRAAVLLGGVDSALVAALLHRLGKQVETFSFHYEEAGFNQPHTDTLEQFLGIKHHWVPIRSQMIAEGIASYSAKFNFPTNWLNYVVQTEHLCRVMRDAGFRWIYSGDGCDGTFLGYPRVHVVASLLSRVGLLNRGVANAVTRLLDFGPLEYAVGRPYSLLLQLVQSLAREMPERGYSTFRVFDEGSLVRLKGGDASEMRSRNEATLREIAAPLRNLSMDRLAYAGKNALSPNRSKMAGSSDSTGVVINAPYLHSGMKSFALGIPDRLLRPQGEAESYNGKYLLFKTCEKKRLLPASIIYQKKISAVDAPVDDWYRGELQASMRRALAGLPFSVDPRYLDFLFARKSIEDVYRRHVASDALTSHALALLVTYSRFTNVEELRSPSPGPA
jgi:asparagine synthetase B (glutamine-hydrolysing)